MHFESDLSHIKEFSHSRKSRENAVRQKSNWCSGELIVNIIGL